LNGAEGLVKGSRTNGSRLLVQSDSYNTLLMPSILFILLLALVIFGPRKLLQVATNMFPTQHPWEKLKSLMTGSVDADAWEAGSLRESYTESPEQLVAPSEPNPSLTGAHR
jgi:hypothetical protein